MAASPFDYFSVSKSSLPTPGQTSSYVEDGIMNVFLHAELQRIDHIINDVEMQEALSASEELIFIILDTNIILHYLEVIDDFIADIQTLSLPMMIIIPGAVINELDGQKNRDGLAWFARRASAWLLKKVKERKVVKGQALDETCKSSGNWKAKEPGQEFGTERTNDGLILDCCKYFLHVRRQRALLCSADKNLCFEAESESIFTISPERSRHWCSRDIAGAIFDRTVDLSRFAPHKPRYRSSTVIKDIPTTGQPSAPVEDDGMDVDDDSPALAPEILLPSHALDLLHIQVVEHFTRLLVELVGRVGEFADIGRGQQPAGGAMRSMHAPKIPEKRYTHWDAPECLGYLDTKKRSPNSYPRLEVFLALPYTRRGARRGQDWSRKDWEVGLDALAKIAAVWEEGYIQESLDGLKPVLENVFASRMRPTGI